ncbi:MAG: sugar-binding domain-containing protein [Bacteroidota bacterium]
MIKNALIVTYLASMLIVFNSPAQVPSADSVLQYSMNTRWSSEVDPDNVWSEYPRPQMMRDNWTNLNGYWQYAIEDKSLGQPSSFEGQILVPFAAESALSGVKRMVGKDQYLWYKRKFKVSSLKKNEKLLLHFGAVDWESTVYINGEEVGMHRGGYDPFTFDITEYLERGEQELVVRVWDPTDSETQPRGKQLSNPQGIWYTPVTGIWQTVWLETVSDNYIQRLKTTPDIDRRQIEVAVQSTPLPSDTKLVMKALAEGEEVATVEVPVAENSQQTVATLNIPTPTLWSPDNPFLYDLEVTLTNARGKVLDVVGSYFGMRKISLGKDANGYTRIMLNEQPLFQFGLLDQGWWPDGLYTAPTEKAMLYDVQVTQEMGFNMIRKHVKVEPARYYYHCDKMGMLVWQDMPNGNYFRNLRVSPGDEKDADRPEASARQFELELQEMMDDFHSFPSIVVWVPFNEGWGQYDTERVAKWAKEHDSSRLYDIPSGWMDRGVGDMIDAHLYPGPGMEPVEESRASVLGEFGGLGWPVADHLWWDKRNWGYLTYQDQATLEQEFSNLMLELQGLIGWGLSAAVYTQTTDVEGEVNGLMTYDREITKIEPEALKEMILPLYQPWWNKRMIVNDSEQNPHEWRVSFEQPDGEWKNSDYDDFSWDCHSGPFSADKNPFLPQTTLWDGDKLFARQSFHLDQVPDQLFIKYYISKAEMKVFVNGQLVTELESRGGRKRHYTHNLLSDSQQYLKQGKNMIAVEVTRETTSGAFDMGLYTTESLITSDKTSK